MSADGHPAKPPEAVAPTPELTPAQQAFLKRRRLIPFIISAGLFMHALDGNVLTTALPTMARELHENPLTLNLAITTYLLCTAMLLPVSGWVADRFGARRVFMLAIVGFGCASLLCGFSQSLPQLIACRALQGAVGAMMLPVGRLVLLKSAPKADMIEAMTTMTMASVLAPVFGPPIGGLILSVASWRWIFWLNVPIAIVGSYMVWRFVPDVKEGERRPLDIKGAILSAVTFGGLIFGLQNITSGILPLSVCYMLAFAGAVCGYFLVTHVRRAEHPILDLSLLRIPSFFAATVGGFFPRLTMSSTPFLLALLLQIGIGLSPLHAGMIICVTGLAQTSMKSATGFFLRRHGFRTVLIATSLLMGLTLGALAFVTKATPILLVTAMCFFAGGFRTIHFSVLAMLAYCDLNDEHMSGGTSLAAVAQQVTQSIGVTFAAFAIHAFMAVSHTDRFALGVIAPAFAVMAILSTMGVFIFWRMSPTAGAEISGAPIRPRR